MTYKRGSQVVLGRHWSEIAKCRAVRCPAIPYKYLAIALTFVVSAVLSAQEKPRFSSPGKVPGWPAVLPGNGLAQHDFLYAGEQKQEKMYIVKGGRIVWSYTADAKGEISDAVRLSNGNIVYAHQFGVTVITPDTKVVWNYDAPAGFETHTAQPIGDHRVLFIQNGNPAQVKIVNIATGATEREFVLPVAHSDKVHGQFRHARLTDAGTLLVAHMDMNKVVEYDSMGRQLWSLPIENPWSAARLANGDTLIATNKKLVREVNQRGETVWEITADDALGYRISGFQIATRLANGNTLVNNWFNTWNMPAESASGEVQALEFTPDKHIVWALSSRHEPTDLGPATTIQLLDDKRAPEDVHFGDIR